MANRNFFTRPSNSNTDLKANSYKPKFTNNSNNIGLSSNISTSTTSTTTTINNIYNIGVITSTTTTTTTQPMIITTTTTSTTTTTTTDNVSITSLGIINGGFETLDVLLADGQTTVQLDPNGFIDASQLTDGQSLVFKSKSTSWWSATLLDDISHGGGSEGWTKYNDGDVIYTYSQGDSVTVILISINDVDSKDRGSNLKDIQTDIQASVYSFVNNTSSDMLISFRNSSDVEVGSDTENNSSNQYNYWNIPINTTSIKVFAPTSSFVSRIVQHTISGGLSATSQNLSGQTPGTSVIASLDVTDVTSFTIFIDNAVSSPPA